MDVRLRIPELFDEKGVNAYRVARDSGGRISMSTIYRIKRLRGRLGMYDPLIIEALCDVLRVTPNDLIDFERDKKARHR